MKEPARANSSSGCCWQRCRSIPTPRSRSATFRSSWCIQPIAGSASPCICWMPPSATSSTSSASARCRSPPRQTTRPRSGFIAAGAIPSTRCASPSGARTPRPSGRRLTTMSESLNFDPIAHRYDDTRGYSAHVADAIAAGLLKVGGVPPGGNLLEIGIGTGRIALPLLARGVNVTGVDISTRMVERLRTKYDAERGADPNRHFGALRVEMADMTALPFADGAFDAVVAVHVLHLVPQWRRALDEALRTVKPGGTLLLGQDTHLGEDVQWHLQTHWLNTVKELGGLPPRVGAAGFGAGLEELKRRGFRGELLGLPRRNVAPPPPQVLPRITPPQGSPPSSLPAPLFA